ncbi:unnamed protein product [Calicophoron daubneyi]|uniref:Uncharacterized protein n=1 Tax=Calicophoron daubneyi TaxID=300641 RepID=A0AAV2TWF7_CALDB
MISGASSLTFQIQSHADVPVSQTEACQCTTAGTERQINFKNSDVQLVCTSLKARGWECVHPLRECAILKSRKDADRFVSIPLVFGARSTPSLNKKVQTTVVIVMPSSKLTLMQIHEVITQTESRQSAIIDESLEELKAHSLGQAANFSDTSCSVQLAYLDTDGRVLLTTASSGFLSAEEFLEERTSAQSL